MDSSPALLLLLALGLWIHGLQGEKRFMQYKAITYLQLGAQLDLTCHISGEDTGVVWVHQDNIETFKFIVFISPLSGATFEGNQKTSAHFEARKEDVFYRLVVKSFTPHDEGNYFCIKYIDKELYFSHGQLAFLSVARATPGPTTPGHSTQCGITEKDSCLQTPDPDRRTQGDLDYFCLVFLWVPLAGLCLLLLQLLAITIVLCRR
ncbi:CD8A protein, partial [Machaerirhynchus nigripectus]|nr:CD8A protein [Machaerirhynchus nigripectus]